MWSAQSVHSGDEVGLSHGDRGACNALRREDRRRWRSESDGDRAAEPAGPAVLLWSPSCRCGHRQEAERLARSGTSRGSGESGASRGVRRAAHCVAREAGVDDNLPSARVHVAGDQRVTCAQRARRRRRGHCRHDERTSTVEQLDLLARGSDRAALRSSHLAQIDQLDRATHDLQSTRRDALCRFQQDRIPFSARLRPESSG